MRGDYTRITGTESTHAHAMMAPLARVTPGSQPGFTGCRLGATDEGPSMWDVVPVITLACSWNLVLRSVPSTYLKGRWRFANCWFRVRKLSGPISGRDFRLQQNYSTSSWRINPCIIFHSTLPPPLSGGWRTGWWPEDSSLEDSIQPATPGAGPLKSKSASSRANACADCLDRRGTG